jgi:hypothetical protein
MVKTLLRSATNVAPALVAALLACSGQTGPTGSAGSPGSEGQQGPAGPQGSPGVSPQRTLSAVVPTTGLLARDLDVMILGNGTTFDATSQVAFGYGVTVASLEVVSPTGLRAHLEVNPAATIGPRDVTVRTGDISLVGHGAFQVAAAITTSVSAGTPQQGAIVKLDVENMDSQSFGTTALIGPINTLGTENLVGNGASSTGSHDSFLGFVDPLAPAGATIIEAVNVSTSNDGATVFQATYASAPGAVQLLPVRSIDKLPVGSNALSEALPAPYATHPYVATTPSSGLVSITVTGTGARIVPRLNVYPTSGRSDDFVAWAQAAGAGSAVTLAYPVDAAANTFGVVSDASLGGNGGTDYAYSIAASFTPVDVLPETIVPHYATAFAQPLCDSETPNCLLSGKIGGVGEYDVYLLPTLPPDAHQIISARLESDSRVWMTTDPWMKRVDTDFTPPWPQHVGSAQVGPSSEPTYLIVEGRAGGSKPLGDYLLATTIVTAP